MNNKLIFAFVGLVACQLSFAAVGDQFAKLVVAPSNSAQMGHVAFIDPSSDTLLELDMTGKVVWEYHLPRSITSDADMRGGADVKWLAQSDHFLLAIPHSGVFEIDRNQQVVWSYETKFADHDVARLPNGNTIFVCAWDGDNDPILTEVTTDGKIAHQFFAKDFDMDVTEKVATVGEKYSNTHTNAVRRVGDNDYFVSMRNFNQVIRFTDGKVVARIKRAMHVHDPIPTKNGIYFAMHLKDHSVLVKQSGPGNRKQFFSPEPDNWHPLRTDELLRNENILITGSTEIGQLDELGTVIWSLVIDSFSPQKARGKNKKGYLYKAAFVYK